MGIFAGHWGRALRAAALATLLVPGAAAAAVIDLGTGFSATGAVTVSGTSATFAEDGVDNAFLFNDPGLGDPVVIIPGVGSILQFDYSFTDGGVDDEDEFSAVLIDAMGNSLGALYEFFATATGGGRVTFNLSGLVGQVIGLQFGLSSLPGDTGTGAVASIRNVEVTAPIPVPAALPLGLSALVLLMGLGRVRYLRG